MDHEGSIFHSGCAVKADIIYFSKEVDSVAAKSGPNSSFLRMDGEEWFVYDESGAWPAIGMATVKPIGGQRTVVAVGPAGQYWEVLPLSMQESQGRIDDVRESIRGVKAVGDSLFVVGMGRLVMERIGTGQWQKVGPQSKPLPGQVIGFEDIAGLSASEFYTVGWQGEIWRRDDGAWSQVDSPVSANLNAVACSEEGVAYVVGDNGVMLAGRNESWRVVETGRQENLLDVCVYEEEIYVVTDFDILRLEKDKLVADSNFVGGDRPVTCLHLFACQNAVFSMGPSDLFRLRDGPWERLV